MQRFCGWSSSRYLAPALGLTVYRQRLSGRAAIDQIDCNLLHCICLLLAQTDVSLRRECLVAVGGEADIGRTPPACRCEAIDPNVWSGRALQENFDRDGGFAVLHQCIRPLIGAFVLRAIMGISARAISLADRPQRGHSG